MSDAIDEAGVASARIRSPLTCDADEGVCAKCCRDLARGTIVNVGGPLASSRHNPSVNPVHS